MTAWVKFGEVPLHSRQKLIVTWYDNLKKYISHVSWDRPVISLLALHLLHLIGFELCFHCHMFSRLIFIACVISLVTYQLFRSVLLRVHVFVVFMESRKMVQMNRFAGHNQDANIEHSLVDPVGEETNGESSVEAYTLPYVKSDSQWKFSVWCRELKSGRDGTGGGKEVHLYTKGWFMLMYGRNKLLLLLSSSVVSDSLWPHGLQHPRLPCPYLPKLAWTLAHFVDDTT